MAYWIAGVDVHKKMLAVVIADVAVDGEYQFERRTVSTSPGALRALAAWLVEREVEEVVMESPRNAILRRDRRRSARRRGCARHHAMLILGAGQYVCIPTTGPVSVLRVFEVDTRVAGVETRSRACRIAVPSTWRSSRAIFMRSPCERLPDHHSIRRRRRSCRGWVSRRISTANPLLNAAMDRGARTAREPVSHTPTPFRKRVTSCALGCRADGPSVWIIFLHRRDGESAT
jgi:hypothetical protein